MSKIGQSEQQWDYHEALRLEHVEQSGGKEDPHADVDQVDRVQRGGRYSENVSGVSN